MTVGFRFEDGGGGGAEAACAPLAGLPVVVCGPAARRGARWTEAVAGRLRGQGLRVAVVRQTCALGGAGAADDTGAVAAFLAERSDLVLVEAGAAARTLGAARLRLTVGGGGSAADAAAIEEAAAALRRWLGRLWTKPPVFAAVLIGGRGRRIGRPKHLLETHGKTWLRHTVEQLRQVAQTVVLVGQGAVPSGLWRCPRLADVPAASGPMAGILSAMRWAPRSSWLVCACDLPNLQAEALRWLLSTRRPGVWATMPRLRGSPGVEPLLAHYDFRARPCLEALAREGNYRPAAMCRTGKVACPEPPAALASAWTNVNTREDLRRHEAGGGAG